ncbi:MAG: hypothetical protein ACR2QK_08835 [Acidimicrobiales bacterium]
MTEGAEPTIDLQDLLRPDEQRRFRRLCIATSPEDLTQLATVIELHIDHIRTNAGQATDVETAEMIAESLTKLVDSGIEFEDDARAQIRGAVEYFLLTDDAEDDLDNVLGFDDDARVVNTVLDRIGHPEYAITLPD